MRRNKWFGSVLFFIILFLAACNYNGDKEISETIEVEESGFSTEYEGETVTKNMELQDITQEMSLVGQEVVTDTLPLMIYYNNTIYYLKESLFVITEEKLRYYDIADNYESIGTIDTFVMPNKLPKVNNSCNFGEESFELYKYSDDDTEFISALWGRVQIWETEEKHNQQ